MTQQQIEQAAINHYATSYSPFDDPYENSLQFELECECFKAGANWALSHQWIPVDEELPKQENERQFFSKDILFRENSSVYFGWYDFEEKYFRNPIGCTFTRVTHWMQIPTLEGGEK